MNIIFDTDVGTDVDDAFALAYLLKNPEANVKAITTVMGNTEIRAKIARKLERMLQTNTPIILGKSGPEEAVKKYWLGFEHLALTEEELQEPIERLPFPKYDEDSILVCIGTLTNIAWQLENSPSIKNVKRIYIMGSSLEDHNLKADQEAAKKVLAAPWTVYQITKQVAKKICFTREELEEFKSSRLGRFLYESAIRWLDYSGKQNSAMYDVLTVSAALGEKYVKFKQESERFVSYDVDPKLKDRILEVIKS